VPYARFVAERQAESIHLEKVSGDLPAAEGHVTRIAIAGSGSEEELALVAARCHFEMHPERKKAFIIALGTSGIVGGILK
jgi:hypothetical protein